MTQSIFYGGQTSPCEQLIVLKRGDENTGWNKQAAVTCYCLQVCYFGERCDAVMQYHHCNTLFRPLLKSLDEFKTKPAFSVQIDLFDSVRDL